MKKVTIKGVDGKEIEAYICSDHPDNFPTDMTDHKVEEVDLNNLNELDVNENSAGGGAHAGFAGDVGQAGIHSTPEYPAMLNVDTTPEEIKKWVVDKKKEAEQYDSPLGKAFEFGYNLDSDPINKLFKMVSNKISQNKVKLDDTIDSDLIDTKDLNAGGLYRIAGMGLTVRFMGQLMLEERGVGMGFVKNKILLKIKHHGTLLYIEERQLIKAYNNDVADYLNGMAI